MPGIRSQIGQSLSMARIGRKLLRHREIGEFRHPLRRNHVGRSVHAARLLPVIPVPPNVVFAFEAIEWNRPFQQVFGHRQPGCPCPNDTYFRRFFAKSHGLEKLGKKGSFPGGKMGSRCLTTLHTFHTILTPYAARATMARCTKGDSDHSQQCRSSTLPLSAHRFDR